MADADVPVVLRAVTSIVRVTVDFAVLAVVVVLTVRITAHNAIAHLDSLASRLKI